jgi:hypothetical protein
MYSENLMGPVVVMASKSGARSPIRGMVVIISSFMIVFIFVVFVMIQRSPKYSFPWVTLITSEVFSISSHDQPATKIRLGNDVR